MEVEHSRLSSSALHFILLFGGELFTGNMMILPVGEC